MLEATAAGSEDSPSATLRTASRICWGRLIRGRMLPSSNDHEDRWNKEQCSYRSEDQSSDYRSAQGAFCSPPSLRPNAIGIIPMIIAIMSKSQSLTKAFSLSIAGLAASQVERLISS